MRADQGVASPTACGGDGRARDLDVRFGDPWNAANPLGFAELLVADERQELLPLAEACLDSFGLNAEFVPIHLGGRLGNVEHLVEVMRTIWRRDPCLGLGYGFSSFIASVNIWGAGSEGQLRSAAGLLLANGRIAAAFHELEHGNDLSHADCAALPVVDGWSLSGRKQVVANIERAEAMVIFARTDPTPGSRSHSQFLVPREDLPAGTVRALPAFESSGMRGVPLGGIELTDCLIPRKCVLGKPGQGIENVLRSFQTTRAALPAICVGVLDTGLRTAMACALERRLYGDAVAALPYVRCVLARAYADLLAVDVFTTVVVRSLHIVPEAAGIYAAAVKSLATRMLIDAMGDLGTVLGAQSYVREGPYAIFQKLSRDLAPAGFGHASRAVCQVSILSQLPRLARRSWFTDEPAPAALFRVGTAVAPLDFDSLVVGSTRVDGLCAALVEIAGEGIGGLAGRLAVAFRSELGRLRDDCLALSPGDMTIGASPEAYAVANRYTIVLAGAACLAVWWHGQEAAKPPLDDVALPAVLDRLWGRLDAPAAISEAERARLDETMFRRAVGRFEARRLFDFTARAVPG